MLVLGMQFDTEPTHVFTSQELETGCTLLCVLITILFFHLFDLRVFSAGNSTHILQFIVGFIFRFLSFASFLLLLLLLC